MKFTSSYCDFFLLFGPRHHRLRPVHCYDDTSLLLTLNLHRNLPFPLDKMILIVVVIRHSKHPPSSFSLLPHTQHTRLIHILSSFKSRHERTSGRWEKKRWQRTHKKGARNSIVQSVALRIDDDISTRNVWLWRWWSFCRVNWVENFPTCYVNVYEWISLWVGGNEAFGKSNGAGWNDEECKLCIEDWKVCLWISCSLLFSSRFNSRIIDSHFLFRSN